MFCCICAGSCNHVGPHSFCAAHGGLTTAAIVAAAGTGAPYYDDTDMTPAEFERRMAEAVPVGSVGNRGAGSSYTQTVHWCPKCGHRWEDGGDAARKAVASETRCDCRKDAIAVCITWESGGFVHRCQYRPGHRRRHSCPCGASKPIAPVTIGQAAEPGPVTTTPDGDV